MNLSEYVGLPFTEKGKVREGLNCWGLGCLVYLEKAGIVLPDYEEFYSDTMDERAAQLFETESQKGWIPIEAGQEQPLDFILLRMKGLPWHVGIVGDKGKMLHIERGIDSVYESYRCMKWEKRIIGFFRHASMRLPENRAAT